MGRSSTLSRRYLAFPLLLMLFISGVGHAMEQHDVDPWEGFNRKVFAFNEFADKYFLRPAAKAYDTVTPRPINNSVTHFFNNVAEFGDVFNNVLQLKFKRAGISSSRIAINSTLGFFGFFDVASKLGIKEKEEDFGQTLAHYGVPAGPYLQLPFLGPSTVRDGVGLIPDWFTFDPLSDIHHTRTRNGLLVVKYVDKRAGLLKAEELIIGDKYEFMRNAWLQRREFKINDGVVQDSFGDESGWDDEGSWDDEDWEEE